MSSINRNKSSSVQAIKKNKGRSGRSKVHTVALAAVAVAKPHANALMTQSAPMPLKRPTTALPPSTGSASSAPATAPRSSEEKQVAPSSPTLLAASAPAAAARPLEAITSAVSSNSSAPPVAVRSSEEKQVVAPSSPTLLAASAPAAAARPFEAITSAVSSNSSAPPVVIPIAPSSAEVAQVVVTVAPANPPVVCEKHLNYALVCAVVLYVMIVFGLIYPAEQDTENRKKIWAAGYGFMAFAFAGVNAKMLMHKCKQLLRC